MGLLLKQAARPSNVGSNCHRETLATQSVEQLLGQGHCNEDHRCTCSHGSELKTSIFASYVEKAPQATLYLQQPCAWAAPSSYSPHTTKQIVSLGTLFIFLILEIQFSGSFILYRRAETWFRGWRDGSGSVPSPIPGTQFTKLTCGMHVPSPGAHIHIHATHARNPARFICFRKGSSQCWGDGSAS